MPLHRVPGFDDADALPHPLAVIVYVAGVAALAWSAYAFAGMTGGEGPVAMQAEPWRPATSKWSRKPAPAAQGMPTRAKRAAQHSDASAHFAAFALNALLVPLLDDDWPPRWADPSLSFDCEASGVQVDGAPLDVGAPVPDGGFTVRWHMERCMPFEDILALTGEIELKVEPIGGGYQVVVRPARLVVLSAQDQDVLTQAFTARMSLGR